MKTRIGDRDLGYQVTGEGPALLLLHAFPFDRRLWSEVTPRLAERFRVIAMDARGFGESTPPDPFSIADLADDAALLLDALGVPMAAVAGVSMGGYAALAFAARHPARLAALALVDTRSTADSPQGRIGRDQGIALVRAEGAAVYAASMVDQLLSAHAPPPVRTFAHQLASSEPPEAIAGALLAMRERPDRTSELGAIACPTLVVVGSEDAVTPPSDARALQAAIPGARLVEIAGSGHLVPLEAPAAFTAELMLFLDEAL